MSEPSDDRGTTSASETNPMERELNRWPDWAIRVASMKKSDEIVDFKRKVIYVNAELPYFRRRVAHALAHLRLHADAVGKFSELQEDEADALAAVWVPDDL